jgi:hypothetical protein
MADANTDGRPGATRSGRRPSRTRSPEAPFPEELIRLADQHAGEVCDDGAWEKWVAGEHEDRLARLDADLDREPGAAVRVEARLSRAAERARRGSRRALDAVSFGAVRSAHRA